MSHQPKNNISRRTFITQSVSGVTAAGFLSRSMKKSALSDMFARPDTKENPIMHRTLGRTNIRLPIVSMGIMNCFDAALIKKSYEIGVRHFDTSSVYQFGRNEEMLGDAIQELGVRDQVIIGTKIRIPEQQRHGNPDKTKETFLRTADESLKRLKTNYIDILYSHDVRTLAWLNDPGVLEALQYLKDQKIARFIGFSTHNLTEYILNAVQTGFYDVILTSYNYAMGDDTTYIDALKKAASKGIGLIAMKTQCPQYHYRHQHAAGDKLSFYKGKIMHTAVLKWALRNDYFTTAVPGYNNFQQMEEDFSVAYDLEYTSEEKAYLQDRNTKLSMGYCRQCQQCIPSCPYGVDIPTLMRTHMYATCYTNFYQARDTINEIPEAQGLNVCASCASCVATCAHRIDIRKRIEELTLIYV